jgi:hypothetical protein
MRIQTPRDNKLQEAATTATGELVKSASWRLFGLPKDGSTIEG